MGGDPEQDYFADGVTESLTTDLSRIPGAFVIARNTAFTWKGKPFDVKQIGRMGSIRLTSATLRKPRLMSRRRFGSVRAMRRLTFAWVCLASPKSHSAVMTKPSYGFVDLLRPTATIQ
jgi:hypothetical protein